MPSDSEIKALVQSQFGGSGNAYVTSPGHAAGDDLVRMIELAATDSNAVALDIATGGGHVAKELALRCGEVVASDLTRQMLDAARSFITELGLANVRYELADAESLPFDDAMFDIVTCRIAPHHFPNPKRFVDESARVLRAGGRFVLIDTTVPPGNPGIRYNEFEKARDPSHVRSLTVDEWSDLIEDAGLFLETVEQFRKRHVFRDWALRARLPEEQLPALAKLLIGGGSEMEAVVDIECDGDELIAFSDQKSLFLARKH